MHAATLKSARLRRITRVLADGHPHSTRDIARRGRVLAVSACIAELRQNGAEIACLRAADPLSGGMKWNYTMTKAPIE